MEKKINNSIEKLISEIEQLESQKSKIEILLERSLTRNLTKEQLEDAKDLSQEHDRICEKIATLKKVLNVKYNQFANVLNNKDNESKSK